MFLVLILIVQMRARPTSYEFPALLTDFLSRSSESPTKFFASLAPANYYWFFTYREGTLIPRAQMMALLIMPPLALGREKAKSFHSRLFVIAASRRLLARTSYPPLFHTRLL